MCTSNKNLPNQWNLWLEYFGVTIIIILTYLILIFMKHKRKNKAGQSFAKKQIEAP